MEKYRVTGGVEVADEECGYTRIEACVSKEFGVAVEEKVKELAGLNYVFTTDNGMCDTLIQACPSSLLSSDEVQKLVEDIKAICEAICEPDPAPVRHPILDEQWRNIPDGTILDHFGNVACIRGKYGQQVALFPDLLRALVPHLEQYRGTDHHVLCDILNEMNIKTDGLARRREAPE